jgi:two-component sensor histidine kinase
VWKQRVVVRPFSVRAHLAAYGLAVALPLVGLLGLLLVRATAAERTQVETRMLQLAGALSDDIDRDIDRRLAMLRTLATSPALAAADWSAFYAQAKAATQDTGYIVLIDVEGRQIVNTYVPYGTAPAVTGDPATLRRIIETKQPVVSDLFVSLVVKKPVFNISIPILRKGRVRYVLSLGLLPEDLLPILEGQKLDSRWITSIWDKQEVLLARSRDHDRYVGKPLDANLRNEARGRDGVAQTNNMDGARVLLAVAHPKLTEWQVSVNVPVDVGEAPFRASLWMWGGVSAGMILLAALLAFVLARKLEWPLNFTADAARALGRGEPVRSFTSGVREANIVVDALRAAGDELAAREKRQRLLLAELSHRVKNVLAVVQALVSRTLAEGRPDASELVSRRLRALARAHDMLMKTDWQGAPLRAIILAELSAHADQAQVEGPDVMISAKTVQTFALILHELCTNAVKYGALSQQDGRVLVVWRIEGAGDAAHFKFRWQEQAGPPVTAPAKKGFGSTLLESAIRDDASAAPRLLFDANGFKYELDVPLAAIVQEHDESAPNDDR